MKTKDILLKKVSFYPSVFCDENTTRTLFDVLNDIRKGTYSKLVRKVRKNVKTNDIEKIRKSKLQLPAFAPCGVFYGKRYKFEIMLYTQFLLIDIDNIGERFHYIIERLKTDAYVASFWTSSSGKGLQILIYVEYDKPYKPENAWVIHEYCACKQVYGYFKSRYGVKIDESCKDITHIFFLSSESDIHLKNEFNPFPVTITLTDNQMWHRRNSYNQRKRLRKTIETYELFNMRQENEEE